MIKYKEVETTDIEEVPYEFVCDKCGKSFALNKKAEKTLDYVEIQEAHTIRIHGGYGSPFGDGAHARCDLCKNCIYELISPYYYNVDE